VFIALDDPDPVVLAIVAKFIPAVFDVFGFHDSVKTSGVETSRPTPTGEGWGGDTGI
jgi:hypothetical protein